MIVYISGKYSGAPEEINANIQAARKAAIEVWESGNAALCPHLNTANFEKDCSCRYEQYIEGDLDLLARCDAIVMLPNWTDSKGAWVEHDYAEAHKMPIYEYPNIPDRHITEARCPNQVREFINVVMTGYRVHLDKNADYSPTNILGTGEIGLVTRLWDKMTRLMNLSGFNIDIKWLGYTGSKLAKNEAIEDTFLDLTVYGIIAQIFRRGKWGN